MCGGVDPSEGGKKMQMGFFFSVIPQCEFAGVILQMGVFPPLQV